MCVPIVVIGAPLGSLVGSHFHRLVLAAFVYITDTAQLILALIVVKPWLHADDGGKKDNDDPLHLTLTSAAILLSGAIFFKLMEVAGRRLLDIQEARIEAAQKEMQLAKKIDLMDTHKEASSTSSTKKATFWSMTKETPSSSAMRSTALQVRFGSRSTKTARC